MSLIKNLRLSLKLPKWWLIVSELSSKKVLTRLSSLSSLYLLYLLPSYENSSTCLSHCSFLGSLGQDSTMSNIHKGRTRSQSFISHCECKLNCHHLIPLGRLVIECLLSSNWAKCIISSISLTLSETT